MQTWLHRVDTQLDRSWVKYPLLTLFWLFFSYFLIVHGYYHYLILSDPNQLEYREGAMLIPTHLLLMGKNPYDLEYMPVATNVYGIVYPLVVYPFAKLLGPSLFTHRLVTAIFIALSCLLLALALRRERVALPYIAAATLLFYQALLFFVGPVARPDSTGEFFFLASLLTPVFFRYNTVSLFISLILGIIAFYTKIYFILSLLFIGIYLLLFVSMRRGILYSSIGLVLLMLSMLLVNYLLPTYFVNTLLVQSHATHQSMKLSGDNGFTHMLMQFKWFLTIYYIIIVMMVFGLYYNYKAHGKFTVEALFIIGFILSTLIIYVKLGRNDGNMLVYLLHLMLPLLLISSISVFSSVGKLPLALLIMIPLSHAQGLFFPEQPGSLHCKVEWRTIEKLISRESNILASPVLTSLILKQGRPIYDSGQTIYFFHAKPQKQLMDNLFFPSDKLWSRLSTWSGAVFSNVKLKKFSAIIMPTELFNKSEIEPYYEARETMTLCMPPSQDWDLVIYRPRR